MSINIRYASKDKCASDKRDGCVPNHRYPKLCGTFFTAGDVDQFSSTRIYETLKPVDETAITIKNRYADSKLVYGWAKNHKLNPRAVSNTFKYLFFKFKKGIFVKIHDNQLVTFLPFFNVHYKNEWSDTVKIHPKYKNIKEFVNQSSTLAGYKPKSIIKPLDEWVANNSIVRYEYGAYGDNNVAILHDMFDTLCRKRKVADVEFFLNRRDFPLITVDETEPYNHMYGSENVQLKSHNYKKYAPILSGSGNDRFADILTPTYEDWARAVNQATGEVFPNECRTYPKIVRIPWKDKITKAVFRGSSTGAGSTPDTNQRLKVLEIAKANDKYMDVGITKWNLRIRKHETDDFFRIIERSSYPVVAPLSLQEQSKFKYIITLEGHVAAYRLSYEMSSGSVILLATSDYDMWFYKFLEPWVHFVPVNADLSDLVDRIKWCTRNDAKCEKIAENAYNFYSNYLGASGVLDYLQKELYEISEMVRPYEYFPNLLDSQIAEELASLSEIKFKNIELPHPAIEGPRCIGTLDGKLKMFRSVPFDTFKKVKILATNKNGSVELARRNNVFVAVKRATNREKAKEHVHEAYIGLKAVNSLIADVPNFAYTFGTPEGSDNVVVSEYVNGVTMSDWIKSPRFSFDDYVSLLIQLNLALKVAQDTACFIHYDLCPWNIMIQEIPSTVEFDYHVRPNVVLRVSTNIIPVIIDYGKSRAIVYEEDVGLVDHGFVNLFRSNSMIDTATLIVHSLIALKSKISPDQFIKIQSFLPKIGLEENVEKYKHYGDLFEMRATDMTPLSFVDFLLEETLENQKIVKRIDPRTKLYIMERGNPVQTFALMKEGDRDKALLKTLNHINESTFPDSRCRFFQNIIKDILIRRLSSLADDIESNGSPTVKEMWQNISKNLFTFRAPTVEYPDMDVFAPKHVYLDRDVNPAYVRKMMKINTPIKENMAVVWKLCADAYLTSSEATKHHIRRFINIESYGYLNAIASQNTLKKLAEK